MNVSGGRRSTNATSPSYDRLGVGYAGRRRADPRIATLIEVALGDARSVVNVGAGAGSYEPAAREVMAIEPSATMIAQRPPGSAPCVEGSAEALPLGSGSVDAAMAVLTIHHWRDQAQGLREMRRVARRRVVLFTFVSDGLDFWLTRDYFLAIRTADSAVLPCERELLELLEAHVGPTVVGPAPIPHDCVDGMLGAFWRRPERYLDPAVRSAMSVFSMIPGVDEGVERLRADLASGGWAARNRAILGLPDLDVGYRLARCEPG